MMYKAKVAVCSDIRTKHSTQSERHVEFFNVSHFQHKLIGFYNRDEKCLLRGTNWVFK